jgi:hypothetical protein
MPTAATPALCATTAGLEHDAHVLKALQGAVAMAAVLSPESGPMFVSRLIHRCNSQLHMR